MTHSRSSSDDSLHFEKAFEKEYQLLLLEMVGKEQFDVFRGSYETMYKHLQTSRTNERQLEEECDRLRATQALERRRSSQASSASAVGQECDEAVHQLETALKEKSAALVEANRKITALERRVQAAEGDAYHFKTQVDVVQEEAHKKTRETRQLKEEMKALRKEENKPLVPPFAIPFSSTSSPRSPRNVDRTTPREGEFLRQMNELLRERDEAREEASVLKSKNDELRTVTANLQATIEASKTGQTGAAVLSELTSEAEPDNGERLDDALRHAEDIECREALDAAQAEVEFLRKRGRELESVVEGLRAKLNNESAGWGNWSSCGRSKCWEGGRSPCGSCSSCCMPRGPGGQPPPDQNGRRPWYAKVFSPASWFGSPLAGSGSQESAAARADSVSPSVEDSEAAGSDYKGLSMGNADGALN
ncbi:unnamed protein product [Vitrella brassicaformis CCMP3155]|uniref:Uncharacterized protein n=2 Tax=Vitrella brassicaformis TaxID=1169539 RepID=A0A0G4GL38_VITBC|nr:unnamed protein product [Vitrella brassicaformis CCMP3155]|eukprot:CEM30744.1 unnamed protein product [Vitrella brassicaformis CCMP3155]